METVKQEGKLNGVKEMMRGKGGRRRGEMRDGRNGEGKCSSGTNRERERQRKSYHSPCFPVFPEHPSILLSSSSVTFTPSPRVCLCFFSFDVEVVPSYFFSLSLWFDFCFHTLTVIVKYDRDAFKIQTTVFNAN